MIKANKNTTRSLVAQLKTIEEVYQNDKKNLDFFTDSYKNNFNFEIGINQEKNFSNSFSTPPILINSTLYILDDNAKLFAFE